jgi:hypothetical protein
MSDIQNVHISFPERKEKIVEQTAESTTGAFSINIQAGEEWIVIGRYRDYSLCAVELTRISLNKVKG